jgi:hypothetical protein
VRGGRQTRFGPRHRTSVDGGRKARALEKRCPSTPNSPTAQTLSVTDGRTALGTVELIDRIYIATDTTGTEIGRFDSLREATRAFDRGRG